MEEKKVKIKELVGKGIGSYHTKVKQQIDRIEKKNKEQNHKISMLTKELDDDYLTKTEEGSVISLDHSKEGMVYIDSLEGNTLVNYCTDGAKEMTLNGDIDTSGTFVTTTEGVDDGKVDVYCEGNTLVNHCTDGAKELTLNGEIDASGTFITTTEGVDGGKVDVYCEGNTLVNIHEKKAYRFACDTTNEGKYTTSNGVNFVQVNITETLGKWFYVNLGAIDVNKLKPSTKYTIIFEKSIGLSTVKFMSGNGLESISNSGVVSNNITTVTTSENLTVSEIILLYGVINGNAGSVVDINKAMILEGDWTNKEIPAYFEGMKSVGQDDVNGHKIEILSKNKNLFKIKDNFKHVDVVNCDDNSATLETNSTGGWKYVEIAKLDCEQNTDYSFSYKIERLINGSESSIKIFGSSYDSNGEVLYHGLPTEFKQQTFNTKHHKILYVLMYTVSNAQLGDILHHKIRFYDIQLEKNISCTNFVPYTFNKKEISLNEPLRGLPNGIKDKFVKKEGKWYVERNCGEVVLNGSESWYYYQGQTSDIIYSCYTSIPNAKELTTTNILCDKIKVYSHNTTTEYITMLNNLALGLDRVGKNINSTSDFKAWLQANPITVIYQLTTPTYEPIENIELITYLETTHISNNSLIPCNMQVKNTGYNAIIKPSTLYTVALDTNKSGTIGLNLGGAKGTTANNVATVTTPATLSDDSLRVYGKGIKGSKVRLLEGDKTNWIPSHFEGMKSSFEDKVQSDGTYKMEILMNNENIFNDDFISRLDNNDYIQTAPYLYFPFKVNRNKKYVCILQATDLQLDAYCNIATRSHYDYPLFTTVFSGTQEKDINVTRHFSTTTMNAMQGNTLYLSLAFNKGTIEQVKEYLKTGKIKVKIIETNNSTNYIPRKFNKIQFSSIEPLRGLDNNIKDRFVFKDGNLMIKRECGEKIFNGTENWTVYPRSSSSTFNNTIAFQSGFKTNDYSNYDNINLRCNLVPSQGHYTRDVEGVFEKQSFRVSVNKSRLNTLDENGWKEYLSENNMVIVYPLSEPTYEEIPYELQKIILEGYENGTLFIDTNIPPTVTTTYAGQTPIVSTVNESEVAVANVTSDINNIIVPYLCDMDYRIVALQLQNESVATINTYKMFGSTYDMLKRDIISKRYSSTEYLNRISDYHSLGRITDSELNELKQLVTEVLSNE